jgi:RimJ/RimL family protein N-acetyltransferase
VISLPLETERLVIRPFEPERDAEPLHELWGDAEAMQFVPSGPRASVDQTRELLESLSGRAPEFRPARRRRGPFPPGLERT